MSSVTSGTKRHPTISFANRNDGKVNSGDLMKSAPRRGKRAKADLGLPPEAELLTLARVYLETQRRLWPEVANAGLLPEPTQDVLSLMVVDFRDRHRGGAVNVEPFKVFLKYCEHLAGSYSRFSCDNSDPKSINGQLVEELERAHREDRFVVWQYTYCDYSLSGFDSSRQGYNSYKNVLANREHLIETTYIDDFSRASREEIEWWKLASVSRKHKKRLIGASDNFDLSDPDWEINIKLYALFSMLFKLSLQQKVRRGMRAAFREGGVVGRLILGHGRIPRRDDNGQIVRRPSGQAKTTRGIDLKGKRYKRLLYRLFLKRNWSLNKIARAFSKNKVDGWDRWSVKALIYELCNPANIGVFIWNQHHWEYNWEEEKLDRIDNPRSEWEFYINKDLALVEIDWWKKARRKLAASRKSNPRTGTRPSRNELSPTTLFSGTLFCKYCMNNEELSDRMAELKLLRSTPIYKQLACMNGARGQCGCELTSSKSTSIVEKNLLPFVFNDVFCEAKVRELFVKSNHYLEREARKPKIDIRPMQKDARKLKTDIKKLFDRVKECDNESLCKAYDAEIAFLQFKLDEREAEIREAQQRNAPPPPPLDLDRVKDYLTDVRDLLNQDIPAAGAAIRELTGRILIHQEKVPGRRKPTWIATFPPKMLEFLRYVAREKNYPERVTLENLCAANWIKPEEVVVEIDDRPEYQRIAAEVGQMAEAARLAGEDVCVKTIAQALGKSYDMASLALSFAETGQRPGAKRSRRPSPSRLGRKTKDLIDDKIRAGGTDRRIAKDVGCCPKTVWLARKKLQAAEPR